MPSAHCARVFRGFYPNEVAGMVLIDPTSEDLTIRIHNHIELFRRAVLLAHAIMGDVGYMRLKRQPLLESPKRELHPAGVGRANDSPVADEIAGCRGEGTASLDLRPLAQSTVSGCDL